MVGLNRRIAETEAKQKTLREQERYRAERSDRLAEESIVQKTLNEFDRRIETLMRAKTSLSS